MRGHDVNNFIYKLKTRSSFIFEPIPLILALIRSINKSDVLTIMLTPWLTLSVIKNENYEVKK